MMLPKMSSLFSLISELLSYTELVAKAAIRAEDKG